MFCAPENEITMNESVLIYDGECPVCASYVAFAEVRRKVPGLRLVSAREDDPAVREAWKRGINLNDEMALRIGDKWYGGAEAILGSQNPRGDDSHRMGATRCSPASRRSAACAACP